jgi:hypothetical protein
MYWFRYNEWQKVPGSDRFCDANGLASVACGTVGPCFLAGTYYDGSALLFAIDELGVSHPAEVYAPPRFISCTVCRFDVRLVGAFGRAAETSAAIRAGSTAAVRVAPVNEARRPGHDQV